MPFHKVILERANQLGLGTLVVVAQANLLPPQIGSIAQRSGHVQTAKLASLGITGTPTIILVSGEGKVEGLWVGKLNSSQEATVLSRLGNLGDVLSKLGSPIERVEVKHQDLPDVLSTYRVLDVRSREEFDGRHYQGAYNIPLDELDARVAIEVAEAGPPIAIDCSALDSGMCKMASEVIAANGFRDVWLLDDGALGAACFRSPTR